MTLLDGCEWLGNSWLGAAIRDSKWGFAVIEMVHLAALALLGGGLLVTGLRVFGFFLADRRPQVIVRDLGRLLVGSLGAMLVSGTLLFADGPLRYYGNVAFRVKLALIAGASATGVATYLIGVRGDALTIPATMKVMALLSLSLWLAAGIAGRVIGVL